MTFFSRLPCYHMDVSENSGTPKSSILGFSIINHPFWGIPIFGNPHIQIQLDTPPTHVLPFPPSLFSPWDGPPTAATMYKSSTSFSREFRPDGLVVKQMPPKGHNKTWHLPAGNKSIRKKNLGKKLAGIFFLGFLVKFTKKNEELQNLSWKWFLDDLNAL